MVWLVLGAGASRIYMLFKKYLHMASSVRPHGLHKAETNWKKMAVWVMTLWLGQC